MPAVKPNALKVMQADGIVDLIANSFIHGNVDRAVDAELANDRERHPREH